MCGASGVEAPITEGKADWFIRWVDGVCNIQLEEWQEAYVQQWFAAVENPLLRWDGDKFIAVGTPEPLLGGKGHKPATDADKKLFRRYVERLPDLSPNELATMQRIEWGLTMTEYKELKYGSRT